MHGAKPTETLFFSGEDFHHPKMVIPVDRGQSSAFHVWCEREKTQGWLQKFTIKGNYYRYKHDILLCDVVWCSY
jgi:hypothetical protein